MVPSVRTVISRSLLFTSLVKIASILKVSCLVGSCTVFFSATHAVFPLTGAFGGMSISALVVAFSLLYNGLIGGVFAPFFLTYHIPGLFASAYWAYDNWLARALVPLACMVLFIIHPQGIYAAPYALFWLIPVVIFMMQRTSIFAHSLASTFIAHAVGSVIWLYTVPMTTAQWYALMPLVIAERLLFASGMSVMHYALTYMYRVVEKAKTLYSSAMHQTPSL